MAPAVPPRRTWWWWPAMTPSTTASCATRCGRCWPAPSWWRSTATARSPAPTACGRAPVIGDRIDADLAGAAAAGLDGALVLSGVCTRAEAEAARDPAPVAVAADLHSLVVAG